jgi:hypothetical protein
MVVLSPAPTTTVYVVGRRVWYGTALDEDEDDVVGGSRAPDEDEQPCLIIIIIIIAAITFFAIGTIGRHDGIVH